MGAMYTSSFIGVLHHGHVIFSLSLTSGMPLLRALILRYANAIDPSLVAGIRLWNFVFRGAFCRRRKRLMELRETAMGDRADDAWEKAAACERHAQATSDSNLKAVFLRLRQSWIRAANDAQFDRDLNANEERVGHTE